MNISSKGLALTMGYEGLRLVAYRDCAGILTIGYGHTGPDVHEGLVITDAQAEALLYQDMQKAVRCANTCVKVPLTQGQFDALADFAFNAGVEALTNSTLVKKLNAGDYVGAADQFALWVHGGGVVVAGLVRRRNDEAAMFRKVT